MYATGNKKMLNMLILEILRKYSDQDHSLTQQDIIKLLDKNYGMECDRRSVKSNVLSLKDMGYEKVELIDTTDGMFMKKSEALWMALSGSALLTGIK